MILGSRLYTAVRKKMLARSPIEDVETVPTAGTFDHDVLDDADIARLIEGFRGMTIFPIVAVSVLTGMRLREVLALR